MEDCNEYVLLLRQAVEAKFCHKLRTPKDFDLLAETLTECLGERVSTSTLKRIWGYVSTTSMPRIGTLDVLAQFVGADDWENFVKTATACQAPDEADAPPAHLQGAEDCMHSEAGQQPTPLQAAVPHVDRKWRRAFLTWVLPLLVLAAVAASLVLPRLGSTAASPKAYVIRTGQRFASTNDYLRLFGIRDAQQDWSVPLPHRTGIILWGPAYLHPDWHNEGCADSLMPTITEYWQPADTTHFTPVSISTRNTDNYLRASSFNELRITFMKNLPQATADSAYTFLGVYRLNIGQSDSTHLVWQRVAKECDLANLDYLEQLRN